MSSLPRPAQYLLRIDDLCPTMHARRWNRLRLLIEEFKIRPILAVIPDNQDHSLDASTPDPSFWNQMRAMKSAGATIALHGFRHLCRSTGRSLLRINRTSEFAGVAIDDQRRYIATGLAMLRAQGLDPELWVAPRHGFDTNTLRALNEEGIRFLSDGLARIPFQRGGLTWIPQQLWSPVIRSKGLWTICLHPNSTDRAALDTLRAFLQQHGSQFTSFDRVAAEYTPAPLPRSERLYEIVFTARWRLRRAVKERMRQSTPVGCPFRQSDADEHSD
jgi:predicted deacetylase